MWNSNRPGDNTATQDTLDTDCESLIVGLQMFAHLPLTGAGLNQNSRQNEWGKNSRSKSAEADTVGSSRGGQHWELGLVL